MDSWQAVNEWRKAQRTTLRARRQALPPAERRAAREAIGATLHARFPELSGAVLGSYWPIRGEVDVLGLVRDLVQQGARAALPVVVERNRPVEFWEWHPGTKLVPGIWKIPVPAERAPLHPTALLVPLLGFDGQGYRLGNGGGYYDRTLATLEPRPLAIGLGYELGRLETVHPQPHDIPMDIIVTEVGAFWPEPMQPQSAPEAGFSSPVCYAEQAAPEYFGFLDPAQVLETLDALLEEARAGTRLAAALRRTGESDALRETLGRVQADEGRFCAMLIRHIRRLGGEPGSATGAFYDEALAVDGLAARLGLLNRGQERAARTLREVLPRVRDDAMHADLNNMLAVHEHDLERCAALLP